jgi:hypothetical protein
MPNRSRNKAGNKTGFDYIATNRLRYFWRTVLRRTLTATVGDTKRVVFGGFGTS